MSGVLPRAHNPLLSTCTLVAIPYEDQNHLHESAKTILSEQLDDTDKTKKAKRNHEKTCFRGFPTW